MIKKVLLAIAALIVLLVAAVVILAFTVSPDYKVEREVTINRPKSDVFAYVKKLKNQNTWGPWFKKDPAMKQDFKGEDGYIGFVSAWKSTNPEIGEGEQEIKNIVEGSRLDTELRFIKPFESTNQAFITTEATGNTSTRVRWGFTGSMPRPMNLMLLMMDMDKEVGKDFQEGLSNLKEIMETPPTVN